MLLVRKLVFIIVGAASYPFLAIVNRFRFSGGEHLKGLPLGNVLLVSNHQTYFIDVMAMFHVVNAVYWGKKDRLGIPSYFLGPFVGLKYVAAEQTMNATWLARFFTLGGCIPVKRTWHSSKQEVLKGLDSSDIRSITRPLASSWVLTFPQGTTTPFAPGRKGTAVIIKHSKPVVIPVVIRGFREAFHKQKLQLLKTGVDLSVTVKAPLKIDYNAPADEITAQIMAAIEEVPPQGSSMAAEAAE